jgi:hypothetical protein
VFKVDGKEFLNQEFAYHDEKAYTFESTHKWQPSDHTLSIELAPTVPPEKKETIIDLFVHKVTIEGPLEKDHWVGTENYEKYFPRPVPNGAKQRRAYASELLTAFASKAYRRPLNDAGDDTGARLAALAESFYREPGKSFEEGVAHAMAAVLSSPRFLFKLEAPAAHPVNTQVADVDEYSLASRLSYFLWSTMPDAELMQLASRGELRKNLGTQVKRMLADARADNFAGSFTGHWLQKTGPSSSSSTATTSSSTTSSHRSTASPMSLAPRCAGSRCPPATRAAECSRRRAHCSSRRTPTGLRR